MRNVTPELPGSPTPAATPVTSSGRRIASELEELGPDVLTIEMKAGREPQSSPRETYRRAARRRPEEMTQPGEERVGVLLAAAVQKFERPVSRELLPLPIPFLENEVVKKRADTWAQSGRKVSCQEARGLVRLGQR